MEITLQVEETENLIGQILSRDLTDLMTDPSFVSEDGGPQILSAMRVVLEFYCGDKYE